jgi:hypothetical protein
VLLVIWLKLSSLFGANVLEYFNWQCGNIRLVQLALLLIYLAKHGGGGIQYTKLPHLDATNYKGR